MAVSDFIHNFVPGSGEDPRTLLVLHGTGGDENSLVALGQTIMPGADVLSPRGKVMENGMPRFFRRFGEGVFDLEDLRLQAGSMAAFIQDAADEYGFDPDQVIAMGYSNGANMAWTTLLLHPSSIQSLVLFRPMVTLPGLTADLNGKTAFLSSGKHDPIVPIENAEELVRQMTSCGLEVSLNIHRGGHELGHEEIDRAREFLAGE